MYEPFQLPTVAVLLPNTGVTLTDVIPTVAAPLDDSGELLMRGRIRRYNHVTAGGRFDVNEQFGARLDSLSFNVPGQTLTIELVEDASGITIPIFTSVGASGVFDTHTDILIPPGWHLACTTPGALTADGAIVIEFGLGIRPAVMDYFGNMGHESRPPGPPVP